MSPNTHKNKRNLKAWRLGFLKFEYLVSTISILGIVLLGGLYYTFNRQNQDEAKASNFNEQGEIIGFGYNTGNYTLGLAGDTAQKNTPINAPRNLTNVAKVKAGAEHGIALTKDGSVYTWGLGTSYQLGLGDLVTRQSPVAVKGISNAIDIAANRNGGAAVLEDGRVFFWGDHWANVVPRQAIGIDNAVQIEADPYYSNGGYVFYVRTSDNKLRAINTSGTVVNLCTGFSDIIDITGSGADNAYFLRADGTIYYINCASTGVTGVNRLFTGGYNTYFAVMNDGKVRACGNDRNGKMGTAGITTCFGATTIVSGITNPVDIMGNLDHTLFVNGDGNLFGAGAKTYGALGNEEASGTTNIPIRIYPVASIISVAAALNESFAVMGFPGTPSFAQSGAIMGHGYNAAQYNLGVNDTVNRTSPVKIADGLNNIVKVRNGPNFSIALDASGNVWSWGYQPHGGLGLGATTVAYSPQQITSLTDIVDIATNYYGAAAINSSGQLYLWGYTIGTTPQLVTNSNIVNITQIEADNAYGAPYVYALRNDGNLYVVQSTTSATLVANSAVDFSASAASAHYVVRSNGILYSGNTSTGVTNVKNIFTGNSNTYYITKTDGNVYACGSDSNSRLGTNGATTCWTSLVSNITNPIDIYGNADHMIFINYDGSVWHSGLNSNYQAGDPTTTVTNPVPNRIVPSGAAISAGATVNTSMFVQADGVTGNIAKPDPANPGRILDASTTITFLEKKYRSQKSQFFA